MYDMVAHHRIIDRSLGPLLPGIISKLVVGINADDVEFG